MIPKSKKVKRAEFTRVFSIGRTYHGHLLTLRVLGTNDPVNKASFVVSKDVAGSAVKRNLFRRRGYSVIREILPKIKNGYTLVFFFKKEAASASYREISEEIKTLLSSINLTK